MIMFLIDFANNMAHNMQLNDKLHCLTHTKVAVMAYVKTGARRGPPRFVLPDRAFFLREAGYSYREISEILAEEINRQKPFTRQHIQHVVQQYKASLTQT